MRSIMFLRSTTSAQQWVPTQQAYQWVVLCLLTCYSYASTAGRCHDVTHHDECNVTSSWRKMLFLICLYRLNGTKFGPSMLMKIIKIVPPVVIF